MIDRTVEYRAGQLAGLADVDGLTLPVAVRRAIGAYRAAHALRPPGRPAPGSLTGMALADLAIDAVSAAAASGHPSFRLDVAKVTEARLREQELGDQANLAWEIRDAATLALVQSVNASAAKIITSIQQRHGAVIDSLTAAAKRLPGGCDDSVALHAGGSVREDWLNVNAKAAEAAALRALVGMIEGTGRELNDGIDATTLFESSGALYAYWLAPSGTTSLGDMGSVGFWTSATRALPDASWWLPSVAEWQECSGRVHREQRDTKMAAGAR
jgi:hypothetical protein